MKKFIVLVGLIIYTFFVDWYNFGEGTADEDGYIKPIM